MGIVLSTFPGKNKEEQVKTNSNIQLSAFPKKQEQFKSPSPYGLSGNTVLKPAENRRWGLGWVGDAAQSAYETTKSAFEGLHDSIMNAIDTSSEIRLSDYQKAPTSTPQARQDYLSKAEKVTPLETATKLGQVGTSAANIAFLPVTAQIEAAKQVPVLKEVAKPVDYAFQKIGEVGSNILSAGLDKIPNEILSQKEKDTVRPLVQELGGFTAQALGVKYGLKVGEKGLKSDKLPLSEQNKSRVETGSKIIASAGLTPFSTAYGLVSGKVAHKIYERKNVGKEITPEEAQIIVEEIKQEIPKQVVKEATKAEQPIYESKKSNKITYQPTEKTYGVSDSIAQHAIQEGLEMRFENLPKYDVMSKKEQSMAGTDLMANDYDRAYRIAMGEEKSPNGILPEAVFLAVENKAIREGDTATIYDLAYKSALKQRATEMGQAISMWTERYPNSPTKAIEEIKQAKEVVAMKKLGQKRIKEEKTQDLKAIKEETKKLHLDKERWSSFLDSLKC